MRQPRYAAKKSLGQHFLFDPSILERVCLAAGDPHGRVVFEIGPGPGGLTRALLDRGVETLIAIEKDDRFANALSDWPEAADNRLVVLRTDALAVDYENLATRHGATDTPVMIIANLPYNVGTPLLVKWLKSGHWRGPMALMFQKEVAERACAQPGEPHYGRLAVLSHSVSEPHIAFTLPPGAFKPPPKVDSAVAVFHPLPKDQRFDDVDAIERVAGAAFNQRRKMLRRSLRPIMPGEFDLEAFLEGIGIAPTARAEELSQGDYRRLATAWRNLQPSSSN